VHGANDGPRDLRADGPAFVAVQLHEIEPDGLGNAIDLVRRLVDEHADEPRRRAMTQLRLRLRFVRARRLFGIHRRCARWAGDSICARANLCGALSEPGRHALDMTRI